MKLTNKENENNKLTTNAEELQTQIKTYYRQTFDEQEKNKTLLERIERLEQTVKKLTSENEKYKQYINGVIES